MSTNEENNEASTDAPAGPPPAPAEPQPADLPPPANPKAPSRFYSRLRRGVIAPANPAAAEARPTMSEGVTPDQAPNLRDNLPVRATFNGPTGFPTEDSDRPRDRERERDREPRGRERRGRDRDRERPWDRERDFDRDRSGPRDRDFAPPGGGEAPPPPKPAAIQPAASSAIEPPAATPPPSAPVPPAAPPPPSPRRLRFEDANPNPAARDVQEFRPSRDRSYAEEASRARREQDSRPEAKDKPPGLFGWMKSIFGGTPGEENPSAPAPDVRPPADRGPRPGNQGPRRDYGGGHGGGGFHGQGQGGDFGPGGPGGGKRRRRRRRGGRNRNRDGGGQGGDRPYQGGD